MCIKKVVESDQLWIRDAVDIIIRTAINLKDLYDISTDAETIWQHDTRKRMVEYILKDEIKDLQRLAGDISKHCDRESDDARNEIYLKFED